MAHLVYGGVEYLRLTIVCEWVDVHITFDCDTVDDFIALEVFPHVRTADDLIECLRVRRDLHSGEGEIHKGSKLHGVGHVVLSNRTHELFCR